MGKKGRRKYIQYYISMDLGFCHGPIDSCEQIYFKEKPVLAEDGSDRLTGQSSIAINKPDLFGGNEREGGIQGTVWFSNGDKDQLMPSVFAERVGLTRTTAPGYRGLCHIGLIGDKNSDRAGACVATNSPSVPNMWARLRRASRTLGINQPIIVSSVGFYDSNPIAMIHEAAINSDWGMGGDADDLYAPSFTYAAQICADEKLGLSAFWDRQTTIEEFIAEILDHINGLYFYDPYIGKAKIKLLRDDYDRDSLTQYGPDNANLISFRRKLWGETVNEVTVNFTDAKTGETDSVTYQDIGNIAMQGDVIPQKKSYPYVQSKDIAADLCKRDLQTGAAPLATVQLEVDRTVWKELPGDVIKFKWEPYQIANTYLRVLEVDWGNVTDSKIRVNLIEDIFSFQLAEFELPGGGEWVDPDQDPNSADYLEFPYMFFSVPYTLIQQDFGDRAAPFIENDDNYPVTMVGAIVTPYATKRDDDGNPLPDQHDFQSFYLYMDGTTPTGEKDWIPLGEKTITGHARLGEALPQAPQSRIWIEAKAGGDGPEVGRYCIISNEREEIAEWVMMLEDYGDGSWEVARGVLDTVPRAWPKGVPLYFISESWDGYDLGNNVAYTDEHYKIQPRTSKGLRDLDGCDELITNRPDRHYRPYRPANVKLETIRFGLLDESQGRRTRLDPSDDTWEPREWTVRISWANRNRKMEDSVVRRWTDGDVTPEDGQTTTILIFGSSRTSAGGSGGSMGPPPGTAPHPWGEIARISGLTGTSFDLDIYDYTMQFEDLAIQVMSERDGLESLQGVVIDLSLYIKGYGSDWGYAWGGWPGTQNLDTITGDTYLPRPTSE